MWKSISSTLKQIRALTSSEISNYIAVFGLVAVSGLPFFFGSIYNSAILFLFVIIVFMRRHVKFNTKSLGIMAVFFVVEILQSVFIYPIEFATLMGTYLRFFLCFMVISLCGKKFTHYYVNVIYLLSIIGFVFYVPSIISHNFRNFFIDIVCPYFPALFGSDGGDSFYVAEPTIMIYTFHPVLEEFRNSGPFWEPGAYGVFLNIALIFNIINTKNLYDKKNILFAVAIVSTLSTTGFLALFVTVASFFIASQNIAKSAFILALFLPVAIYLFLSLEFLSSKITHNMELTYDTTSRFGSAVADWSDFSTSPIIGWGKGMMRFGGKEFTFFSEEHHRNNGLSDLLATYGIFVFIVLLYNYYKTLKVLCLANSFNKNFAILSFIVFLIMGFSQSIFQYPFFLGIMFIHLMFEKKDFPIVATIKR